MFHYVPVCCSVVNTSHDKYEFTWMNTRLSRLSRTNRLAVYCSVLQYVAACCSVANTSHRKCGQHVTSQVRIYIKVYTVWICTWKNHVAVCCSVLQCVQRVTSQVRIYIDVLWPFDLVAADTGGTMQLPTLLLPAPTHHIPRRHVIVYCSVW